MEKDMSTRSKFDHRFAGIRNLKIGMQLRIALSAILILLLLLGTVSWFQADSERMIVQVFGVLP